MKKSTMIGVLIAALLLGLIPATVTAQTPPLTETFESAGIAVSFPEGWAARVSGSGGIQVVNDAQVFELMDDDEANGTPPGRFALLILDPAGLTDMATMLSLPDIMVLMAQSLANNPELEVGEPFETTVGELDAVRFFVRSTADGTDGFMIGYLLDDQTVVVVVGVAHSGELDQYEDVAAGIMASVTYDPVAALQPDVPTLSQTVDGAGLTMSIPEDWVADVTEEGITLANNEEALAAALDDESEGPSPGQVALFVLPPYSVEELDGMYLADLMRTFADGMLEDAPGAMIEKMGDVPVPIRDSSVFSILINDGEGMLSEVIGFQPKSGFYIIVVAAAPEDEFEDYQSTIYAIVVNMMVTD